MHRWLQEFAYHVDLAVWLFPAAAALALAIALLTVSAHSILIARTKSVIRAGMNRSPAAMCRLVATCISLGYEVGISDESIAR
jgi:hypothetical protein